MAHSTIFLADYFVPHQHTCSKCGVSFTANCRRARYCPGCRPAATVAAKAASAKRRYKNRKAGGQSRFAFLTR